MGHDVFGGGPHAVAAGLAPNKQQVGLVQMRDQGLVELGVRVVGIGHLGLHGAVVLGPRVAAFVHGLHDGHLPLFPRAASGFQVRMHVVAPGANFAVHRPHHQGVTTSHLQFIQVGQGAWQGRCITWAEGPGAHLGGGDGGERADRRTIACLPEQRMGDVQAVVGVEGDGDLVQGAACAADKRRQTLHVGMGTRHRQCRLDTHAAQRVNGPVGLGQIAEVVLGVNDEEMGLELHGGLLRCLFGVSSF